MSEEQSAVEQKVEEMIEGKPEAKEGPKIEEPVINAPSMIEQAMALKDEMKKATEDLRKENDRKDNINAHMILGGKSVLGNPVEKTQEQLAEEEAKSILAIYGK